MKNALQVFSWIAIVLGILAFLGGVVNLGADPESAYYGLVGGGLFVTEGVLALAYIDKQK